jgi:quercetin dioxygenase-like cupin family protein
MKRVVCGESGSGSTILNDGPAPAVFRGGENLPMAAGNEISLMWATAGLTQPRVDPTVGLESPGVRLGPGDTRFMVWSLPPGQEIPVHRTDTVDFVTVLSGRIMLAAGDGTDAELAAGDVTVILGSLHGWHNAFGEPCVISALMLGIEPPQPSS